MNEKLNLPNQTKSMFFSQVSDVKKSDLRAAKREVERLQQDENHVIDFFVQWRPWQMHLVRTEKADFEKLAVEMKESKDKLLDAHFELDELNQNLREVIEMLLEDGEPPLEGEFIGTQLVKVS